MGGRGSASGKGQTPQAKNIEKATGGGGAKAKAASGGGGGGMSAEEKYLSTSVKSVTKGMTQSDLKSLSRKKLEAIAVLQSAKRYMSDPFQKGITPAEAIRRAKSLVPNETTAQLRKSVWKYRNMD